mgnify:CR=1 FL=1
MKLNINKKKLKILLKTVLSVSLLIFLIYKVDFSKLEVLRPSTFIFIVVAVIINLTAKLIMSVRWKLLLKSVLNLSCEAKVLFKYYMIAGFFNIFLPGAIGGDVVRTQRLIKRYNVSIKSATLITLLERVLGVYSLLVLLILGVLFKNFPSEIKILSDSPLWINLSALILILSLLPILKLVLKKRSVEMSYSFLIVTLFVLLIAQFGDITIAYIFSKAFNINIGFSAFLFVMPLVYIATVLPISLGGLGVREGTFAGLMSLYGVDVSTAIIISFLIYFVKIISGIIGYFVYLREK